MTSMRSALAVVLCVLVAAPLYAAPQQIHVASQDLLDASIKHKIDVVNQDREVVRGLLQRRDFVRIAGAIGIDLRRAEDAIPLMDASTLRFLANSVDQEQPLVGGRSKATNIALGVGIAFLLLACISLGAAMFAGA